MIEKFPRESIEDLDLSLIQRRERSGFLLLAYMCLGWIYCYELLLRNIPIGLAIRLYAQIFIGVIYKKNRR